MREKKSESDEKKIEKERDKVKEGEKKKKAIQKYYIQGWKSTYRFRRRTAEMNEDRNKEIKKEPDFTLCKIDKKWKGLEEI